KPVNLHMLLLLIPQICYILDGILFLYGIILTALYCRIKVCVVSSTRNILLQYANILLMKGLPDSSPGNACPPCTKAESLLLRPLAASYYLSHPPFL
uniref:Uncharacterized protein n=1 Tax=Dicentrarchus labrax TaxID=13489 RepID=A0A8C4IJ77_DICLA